VSLGRFDNRPIYPLSDVTGLVEGVDYLPVKQESAGRANSYDNTGYFTASSVLASVTGLVAWVDYIPVYVVARTTPWTSGTDGYVPFFDVTP